MANTNFVMQLLITAKDQTSAVLSDIRTKLAALGAAIGAAFSLKEAANFEKALDAVRARADETGPALDALIGRVKEAAQTLGPEFGFSATEAVGGIKELIAAGFTAEQSISALKGVLSLAAMEGINVQQAALLLSDAIVQFGLTADDASKVADILAISAGAVAATAVEMGEALKYTGNAASQAGLSLTETSAVLDVLAKSGQRGSEAGTGLASVLNILANPAHAATKALFEMGATSTELGNVLDFLQSRGLNAAETIALFGEQGGRVINTLLAQGGTKAIADFADQITNSGKSAADTAKIMQENLLGAFDRFWESLKRVGTELATPKLEPFANGLDTLTQALNTFASNEKIKAFQAAVAAGFSAIYTAARDFANQIDWAGLSTTIGNAFSVIKSAADSALTSLQSIYASLTGSLPGASSIAQQASDGLKAAWEALGNIAQSAAGGIERIAQALSGPVAVGSDLARQALQALTGETDAARQAYDILNSALKAGTISQEQVAAAWERLQTAISGAQGEINAAQIAYDAVVAAQKAGTATQEQVNTAWERLQTVMGSAQKKIDSARLAFDGLNLQFNTGKGLTEAVALAHERLNSTIESVRQSVEKITSAVDGQTQGFQALWGALQSEAPTFLKTTFDSLATAAGDLLAGINALAQEGAKFIAGFIKNADLSPVRDLFNAVADAARKLVGVIIESFPKAETAGANFADAFTIAWSGVVGILSAVVSGTLKVVESIGRATFEVGKFFNRYSDTEIAKIEANLNGLSDTAGEFAATAARSFEASGAAIDRMRERSEQAANGQAALETAGKGAAKAQEDLAAAAERQAKAQEGQASKTTELAFALQKQKAEVEALSKADLSSEEAKNKQAAATQKLWGLQDAFGEAIKNLTGEQFANVAANEQVQQSLAQLGVVVENGAVVLGQYVGSVREAPKSMEELRKTMETTRAEMQRVEEAYKNGTLKATENKSVTEQLNEARKRAADGLAVYNAALERQIAAEETSVKTAERKRQAVEAVSQSQEALIDASIRLAEIEENEAKVADLVAEKKAAQLKSSQEIAAQYEKEAQGAQAVADALRLKYDTLLQTNPLDTAAIQTAKEAADAAQSEAYAKKAVAIETAAIIPVRQQEAEAAARAAGPIGDLIRLYEKKTAVLDRETSAIERSYASKQRDFDVEIAQAEAKGDTVKVLELKIEKVQLEAEASQAMADAIARQVAAEIELLESKKLNIQASELSIEAKNEEIAKIDELIAKKKEEAAASQAAADTAKAAAAATNQSADATANAGNAAQNTTNAVESLSIAFAKFRDGAATAFDVKGIVAYNQIIQSIKEGIASAEEMAQRLANEGLGAIGANAFNAALHANELADALENSQSYLNAAARAASENLRGALAAARQEAEGLAQSLSDMAQDFEKEMLRIRGDERSLLELEHQENLARLEEIATRAGSIADDEYALAKSRADQLHQLRLQQLADEERADQTEEAAAKVSRLANEAERASRAMKDLSGSSLATLSNQAASLQQHLSEVNSLL